MFPHLRSRSRRHHGYTLLDVLFLSSLLTIVTAISVPALTAGLERSRTRAAARYLTAQMAMLRTHAVSRSTTLAMRFQRGAGGLTIAVYADGNGNGVRVRDIDAGTDRMVEAPVRLEDLFPGVAIAVPATFDGEAVDLGGTELLSFTPEGTSSSGTINLLGRDGSHFAVRILGVTGRIRLLRFEPRTGEWLESF